MIPRKRLQLLLYMLRICYVFSEENANDLERLKKIDDFSETSSFNYIEHPEGNNLHMQSSSTDVEFSDKTTESIRNDILTDDYPRNTDVDGTTVDEGITQDPTDNLNITDELNNEILSEDQKNELSICDLFLLNLTNGQIVVHNLTVNSVGTEWISISWSSTCENITTLPIFYKITICRNNECIKKEEKNPHYNATQLLPCTRYNISVNIMYGDWESNTVDVVTATSNDILTIGEIRDLNAPGIGTNMIRLAWKVPELHPQCVRNYSITQCLKEECTEMTVTDKAYVALNLKPCSEYEFTVAAVTETVRSAGLTISRKTSSPRVSEPQFPSAVSSGYSLHVHWQPPQQGAMCIKHYRVTKYPNVTTEITTDTNITLNGVYACLHYDIYVNAVDADNNDGAMATLKKDVAPVVTNHPTLHASEPSVSATSIQFTWSVKKETNACVLTSVNMMCNFTATEGHGFEPVNGLGATSINSTITDDVLVTNVVVDNINSFTTYTCWAYTINEAGTSELSEPVNATTLEDVPSAPILNIDNITDSHFVLIWDTPEYLAGVLRDFEIILTRKILFPIPDWCTYPDDTLPEYIRFNETTFVYEHLDASPFTSYSARIRAKTTVGWGNYSEPLIFQSEPRASDIVTNFTYAIQENLEDTNILDTVLTWSLPCALNGIIEYFNVSVHGTRSGYAPHFFSIKKFVTDYLDKNDVFSINLEELKGEYNYTFSVSTKILRVPDTESKQTSLTILYPAGIPPQPDDEYIQSITIDPYKARRSTTSAAVLLPLFPNTNGNIVYYSIIISQIGHNPAENVRFDLKSHTWPNMSSWGEAMQEDFMIPYQATRPFWDPYPTYVADYGHMKAVKYTLGDDTTCKEISSNSKRRLYCNGPLKPDTWYHVRIRAFTNGGYTDSTVFIIKTNAELNVGIVIGIVFGILFLGIITTIMLLIRKCSPQVVLRRFLHSDMSGSPVPSPFTRKKFIAHCQQLVDNPGKLSNEFRLLQTLSVDLQMPTNTACLQANRKKNRYSDILPYDFSRVKLEVIDNDPNTDYINASFIRGYSGEDEYIACQGPKEETTYDFWRMVDQYGINMIVMLTQLVEKGKEKCHQYFPAIRETFRYENMTIRCTSELDFRTHTHRTMVLQKGNKKRTITHLHFKDWPDHDVPEDFDPMINFCQIMRRNILANKGFVVIHCSAGIGRTGTLIAIDILLQHLRDNRKLDVFGTVYRLRHNRINMVQRESQYAYIYNCIKQVLKNPYCLKTYKPPPVDPVYENVCRKTTSNSNTNLVSNSETLKKRNFFMSMDSIIPLYDIFSWPSRKPQESIMHSGLRYCKSTGAIDRKGDQSSLGESDSLDCLIHEVLQNTTNESNKDNLNKDTGSTCSINENSQK